MVLPPAPSSGNCRSGRWPLMSYRVQLAALSPQAANSVQVVSSKARHRRPEKKANMSVSGAGDRKSVVSGKSVSVRVDLGGSRIIKKKEVQLSTVTNQTTKKTS